MPVVLTPASPGVSFATYWRDLALKASSLKVVTTGVLYAGTYQGAAYGTEAARRIVSSDLGVANLAGDAPEIPSTARDFQWVYVPSTAEQRRIVKNGYTAYDTATSVLTGQVAGADAYAVGYVTLDRTLAATLAADLEVAILGRFPVLGYEETPGLAWAINEALAVMHWPYKQAVTGVANQFRYDLSATATWLKRTEQLIRVFRPDASDGRGPQVMPGRTWLEPDGEKVYLHIPESVATGDIFYVQLRRPCSTWIKVGSTWASSTVGLVNETDEAVPEVDRVTAVAYWMLATRMARRGPKPQQAEWAAEAKQAALDAAPFLEWQNEPPQPYAGIRLPRHPTGKGWRPLAWGGRRWP